MPEINVDETAKEILDKRNKVAERVIKPTFLPYTDSQGSHSPFTDYIYYKKMPEVYRTFDEPLGKPLYRYLQSLLEGGYAELIYNNTRGERGIDNLLSMLDPQTCPEEFLPYYCKSMGIEWFQDLIIEREGIDPYYFIRTFLCNVGEIYKRRGTESLVKYIAKVLTSMDVKLKYQRVFNERRKTLERNLWVEVQALTQEEIENIGLNSEVVKRYIDTQIPYYLTARVLYVLHKGDITVEGYTGSLITMVKRKSVIPIAINTAAPEDLIYYSTNDGVVIVMYTGLESRIAIPKKIEGKDVIGIDCTAFSYNTNIEYVKLPNTVQFIK